MIKVTIAMTEGKLGQVDHEADYFVATYRGTLDLYKEPAPARPVIVYAPGTWVRAERVAS